MFLVQDLNGQPFQVDNEQMQLPVTAVNKLTGIKRTAVEAFLEMSLDPSASEDHNYHVPSKKKTAPGDWTDLADDCAVVNQAGNVDDKYMRYLERRRKNNAASKRSRETKKNRMVEMEQQAIHIEKENERLRERLVELDRLTKLMKSLLVQKVSSG